MVHHRRQQHYTPKYKTKNNAAALSLLLQLRESESPNRQLLYGSPLHQKRTTGRHEEIGGETVHHHRKNATEVNASTIRVRIDKCSFESRARPKFEPLTG